MADRSRLQVPVLIVHAIVFLLLCHGRAYAANHKHTPSPTPTVKRTSTPTVAPTPSATPTPANCVTITAPAPNSSVSANVAINTRDLCAGNWYESLYVDGAHAGDFVTGQVIFTSTSYANGTHTIQVTSQSANPGSVQLGGASEALNVQNTISTPSVSPTPTGAPTPTGSPAPTSTPTPTGTTYYVSPSGSDSAAGSSAAPWRTIQKAAGTLQPGQTVIVAAGNYGERVSISRSGTQASPITLQVAGGATAQLLGFDITGTGWVLSGFDISTQTNGSEGYGIYVTGSASYVTIQNSYIHELCHEGIFMDSGVSHITVLNNRIWRAQEAAVLADGTNDLIQGNEVWGTQEYPDRAGGIYSGCAEIGNSNADADAFRFFGQHNVFRSNYAHDIYTALPTNPDPHTDCFQTWGSTAMEVDDILIERNTCRWPVASTVVDASTAMIEGIDGLVGTVTFQNNELSDMRQGIDVGANVGALKIYNNTWDHIVEEALIFSDFRSPADEIINNIYYDVGFSGDAYAELPSGSPIFQNNDFYMPGGATVGSYPIVEPYLSVAPMFVNFGDSTGAGADFHLQATSGLKGAGVTLLQVTNDFYGDSRGTTAYSVGAAK